MYIYIYTHVYLYVYLYAYLYACATAASRNPVLLPHRTSALENVNTRPSLYSATSNLLSGFPHVTHAAAYNPNSLSAHSGNPPNNISIPNPWCLDIS